MKHNHIVPAACLSALLAAAATAAEPDPTGEADYRARYGRAEMGISCDQGARAPFERGLLQLHSFAWERARDSFGEAAKADRDCAMAYWGIAMSHYDGLHEAPSPEAVAAARRALARARSATAQTPRESAYIAAAGEIFAGYPERPRVERDRAYSRAMGRIHREYPQDHEAAAFYALSLLSLARRGVDNGPELQARAAGILQPLFDSLDRHPGVAHYLIHAYDDAGNREPGLAAALRYADIAPALRHPQHMPSHIFAGLGMWEESNAVNRVALEASPTYYHSLMYLVYGHLQLGQWQQARQLVENLRELARSPEGGPEEMEGLHSVNTWLLLETRDWPAAARAPMYSKATLDVGETLYVRGIGAARSGDTDTAARSLASLNDLAQEYEQAGGSRERVLLIRNHARQVEGLLQLARGEVETALASLEAATRLADDPVVDRAPPDSGTGLPAHEVLGQVLLEQGRYPAAQREFAAALEGTPNRLHSVRGLARAAARAGDHITATTQYRALLQLLANADPGFAAVAEARQYLAGR